MTTAGFRTVDVTDGADVGSLRARETSIRPHRSGWRAMRLAAGPVGCLAALLAAAACERTSGGTDAATHDDRPAVTQESAATPAAERMIRWQPIREGVSVEHAADGAVVTYTRARGTTSGVALMLTPGGVGDVITLRMSALPAQRVVVCLTDVEGGVWAFPTVRVAGDGAAVALRTADLKPDLYQNQGRTMPARPDVSEMEMLTILDISGHMGAPEADCSWTIAAIEGVER